MLLLLLTLQLNGVATTPICTTFKNGPLEGMRPGPPISRNGVLVSLLPTIKKGPAIPPDLSNVIAKLLESQQKQIAVDPQLLGMGADAQFCAKVLEECRIGAFEKWPIGPNPVPGPPYLLSDGRIRIEWLKEGTVEYLSFITFKGARVAKIDTSPAQIPWSRDRYAD